MKRPARFTEVELARALRAAAKAGVRVSIEVTADGIKIVTLDAEPKPDIASRREIVL